MVRLSPQDDFANGYRRDAEKEELEEDRDPLLLEADENKDSHILVNAEEVFELESLSRGSARHQYTSSNGVSSILSRPATMSPLRRSFPSLPTLLCALLPSFVRSRLKGEPSAPQEKLYPSSHLDGLRGVASLIVFFCHLSYGAFPIQNGWRSDQPYEFYDPTAIFPSYANDHVVQLPLLRLVVSGASSVAVFFVISGYALSAKPVKQMRSGQFDGLTRTTSSSIFRRGFRLFIPCFVSTFIIMMLLCLGFYETTRDFATNEKLQRSFFEFHKPYRGSFRRELRDWYVTMCKFPWVWSFELYGGSTYYDLHLWTIPVEFRASMVLFLTQLGFARLRPQLRFVGLFLMSWFCIRWGIWELVLFYAGFALAEYDQARVARTARLNDEVQSKKSGGLISTIADYFSQFSNTSWNAMWICVLLVGLYFASYPEHGPETSPGFMGLSSMVPSTINEDQKYRWWTGIGAIMIIFAINNVPELAQMLNGKKIQYLGKISYALYLMHGPVIHTWGWHVFPTIWGITGTSSGPLGGYCIGFFLSCALIIPPVIWAADLFWRAVDTPVVSFSKWLESICVDHQW